MTCVSAAHAENTYLFSLATGVTARYEGSRDYRAILGPSFSAQFDNGFFVSMLDGAGYKKTFANGMYVSAALSYADGRGDENRFDRNGSDYLKGMGNIPGALLISLQAGAHVFGDSTVSVTLDQPVTHTTRGVSGHVDLTVPVLQTSTNQISVTGSLHAGNGRYTQTFFGVTGAQSASSGFSAYSTKGGFDKATISTAWTYIVSPRWSVTTTGGLTRLIGSSSNSPIVQTKNNWFGITALTYRY
ncbi:MipA/OmpV family protein [Paraburkholderia sp.]|uniref:MipA/OmpV family protein n=1 Tax=Paraburkholderia sp. TaxID=1926495 RepID=UPI003D6F0BC8